MLDAGWPGIAIWIALTSIAALAAPACWFIAWSVLPIRSRLASVQRVAVTVLACSGVLWWKLLTQTSNDTLSTTSAIWAVALLMLCVEGKRWDGREHLRLVLCALAGALAGLGFVMKLTQFIGVLATLCILPFLEGSAVQRLKQVLYFGAAGLGMSLIAGGSWALESWRYCGSPVYPFLLEFFSTRVPGASIP
jgi:hypothetical protein